MTAGEREALYEGLLAENGTFSGNVWNHSFTFDDSTYLLFVNGGQTEVSISESYSTPKMAIKLLTAGSTASYATGSFALSLQPGGIAFFKMMNVSESGIYREDLALMHLEDGVTWQGDTAVLYKEYNGVPEIQQYVENGETVTLTAGTYALKTFSWSVSLKPTTSAVVYTTP